jgi:hypothetical protein
MWLAGALPRVDSHRPGPWRDASARNPEPPVWAAAGLVGQTVSWRPRSEVVDRPHRPGVGLRVGSARQDLLRAEARLQPAAPPAATDARPEEASRKPAHAAVLQPLPSGPLVPPEGSGPPAHPSDLVAGR